MMLSGVQPHDEPNYNKFTVLGFHSYVESKKNFVFNEISIRVCLEGVTISYSNRSKRKRAKETLE